MIQTATDNNIQLQMEKQYANLNKKLDNLIKKRTENHIMRQGDDNNQFHTRIENLTNIKLLLYGHFVELHPVLTSPPSFYRSEAWAGHTDTATNAGVVSDNSVSHGVQYAV